MGAITYHPERTLEQTNGNTNLDELAEQCQKILNTEYSDKLDELYCLGGTSGGARPKIMTTIDDEEWIIKFPAHVDGKNAGKMEYDEEKDSWRLSPAYDLTYSNTYYGEHTTTVDGNGRNPGKKEILEVGIAAGMKKEVCIEIIDQIEKCVKDMLGEYL